MISVVIPTYNCKDRLEKCLSAFQRQEELILNRDFEIIVVDDGSTDATGELKDKYPIKYFYQNNQGPAVARNLGVNKAAGDIILFIDADCVPARELLPNVVAAFQDKDIAGVKGFYSSSQKEVVAKFAQLEYEYKYRKILKKKYIDFVDTYAAAYQKDIFLKEGGFNSVFTEASGEDIDFSYRLSKKGYKLVANSGMIVEHHHPASLRKYLKRKFKVGLWRFLLYKKHAEKIISDSHTPLDLKIQIVSMAVIFAILPFIIIGTIALNLLYILLIAYALCALPFAIFCCQRKFRVGICALPLIILRDMAITFGLFAGAMRMLFFNIKKDKYL